jgi:hypothetical protein
VLVDHGVTHAESPFPDKVTRRGGIGAGTPPTWPVGIDELRRADMTPAGALDSRMVSADFWRLREGTVPDSKSTGTALPSQGLRLDGGLVVSRAGDLAASWGGGVGSPGWVRVWRRPAADDAPGRGWVLVAELVSPASSHRSRHGAGRTSKPRARGAGCAGCSCGCRCCSSRDARAGAAAALAAAAGQRLHARARARCDRAARLGLPDPLRSGAQCDGFRRSCRSRWSPPRTRTSPRTMAST